MRQVIFGLPIRDPRALLFLLNVVLGALTVFVEVRVIPAAIAQQTWGLPWQVPAFVGAPLWAWILLYAMCHPEDYLPKTRLADDLDKAKRWREWVEKFAYSLGILTAIGYAARVIFLAVM